MNNENWFFRICPQKETTLLKHSVVYLITEVIQVKNQENCSHVIKYLNNLGAKGLVLYLFSFKIYI